MISRRNIRVKVMQALFAFEQNNTGNKNGSEEAISISGAQKLLNNSFEQSSALFYLLLSYIAQIGLYAAEDAEKRAAKLRPTEADKNVSTKIAESPMLTALWTNEAFQNQRKHHHTGQAIDNEEIKKLYKRLSETDDYKQYIQHPEHSKNEDRKMMFFIWNNILTGNEKFVESLADNWSNWEDDEDLMKILVGNYLHKPTEGYFAAFISDEKKEYADDLLRTVIEKEEHLFSFIEPKLRNWEAERIAQIDMVLLKMGMAEFLYFPTIPVKVTINEYIEIAKQYSTDQSGQFVNGVLDNLRKDLESENKLRKVGFRK